MQALAAATVPHPQSFWPPSAHPAARPIETARAERSAAGVERIGKYEVRGVIGAGGFSVVYEGYDPVIRRPVAIKVGHSNEAKVRTHFRREAETAGRLVHANITTIYEFGDHRRRPYLVQEYLPGENLAGMISRRQPESLAQKLDLLIQIACGLGHAHARGIIHRDVKPSNVQVLEGGRIKIMDFGTAKQTHSESRWTQTGIILGTFAYLAPECISSRPATVASDLFSFGVLAYELLSFRRPFDGRNLPELVDQMLHRAPVPLAESWPACPPDLAGLVHKCLAKDPPQRYASCALLRADLERIRT